MSITQWFIDTFIDNNIPNRVEPRMYLILREDLSYKYIQGAHALAQFAIDYPRLHEMWNNQYLICLSVFNGLALEEFNESIDDKYIKSEFYEPDLGNKLTAIAMFESGEGYISRLVKPLKLATK